MVKDMKVIISAAISLDGYLDDCTPQRLKLSSPEDWQKVQELRAQCDAILVGAETIRRDNPSLVIRDKRARQARRKLGMDEDIAKVTLTSSGAINPDADFFTQGAGKKYVFATTTADENAVNALASRAEVIRSTEITPMHIVTQLAARGCRILMIEGGRRVLSMFLGAGIADEIRLALAPLFVGDERAPRLVTGGEYPWDKDNRLYLERVEMLGDTAVMHYRAKK